ncbi:MAG: NUDIX domain-containing protein [Methanobacterium sp.]
MYKNPSLTVDAVIIYENKFIVLIKRKKDPYAGLWALPGGFVEYGETVENATIREVKEETGLEIELKGIVGVYSDPQRDPRGHTVTICYLANCIGGELNADTDASDVQCILKEDIKDIKLAFDHDLIIKDAIKLIKEQRDQCFDV